MKFEIIFYHSGKTSEIEHLISEGLEAVGLTLKNACAATTPEELSEKLSDSLKRTELVMIVGGMESGSQSTEAVLSKVLKPTGGKQIKEYDIKTEDHVAAKLKQSGRQTIVVIPDDPDDCQALIPSLRKKLAEIYSLRETLPDQPETDKIYEELDRQLSSVKRVRVENSTGMTAEKRNQHTLKSLKITIAILLVLAAVQLGAAAYLFLSQL